MPERGRKSFREALQSFAEEMLFTRIYFFCALTPELRRTAARNGGVLHASTQAEPRSGLGLNELLGRRLTAIFCEPTQLTKSKNSNRDACYQRNN